MYSLLKLERLCCCALWNCFSLIEEYETFFKNLRNEVSMSPPISPFQSCFSLLVISNVASHATRCSGCRAC